MQINALVKQPCISMGIALGKPSKQHCDAMLKHSDRFSSFQYLSSSSSPSLRSPSHSLLFFFFTSSFSFTFLSSPLLHLAHLGFTSSSSSSPPPPLSSSPFLSSSFVLVVCHVPHSCCCHSQHSRAMGTGMGRDNPFVSAAGSHT